MGQPKLGIPEMENMENLQNMENIRIMQKIQNMQNMKQMKNIQNLPNLQNMQTRHNSQRLGPSVVSLAMFDYDTSACYDIDGAVRHCINLLKNIQVREKEGGERQRRGTKLPARWIEDNHDDHDGQHGKHCFTLYSRKTSVTLQAVNVPYDPLTLSAFCHHGHLENVFPIFIQLEYYSDTMQNIKSLSITERKTGGE